MVARQAANLLGDAAGVEGALRKINVGIDTHILAMDDFLRIWRVGPENPLLWESPTVTVILMEIKVTKTKAAMNIPMTIFSFLVVLIIRSLFTW